MRQHNGAYVSGTGGHAFKLKSVTSDQMLLLQRQPFWFFFSTRPSFLQNPVLAVAALWLVKRKVKIFFSFGVFFAVLFEEYDLQE